MIRIQQLSFIDLVKMKDVISKYLMGSFYEEKILKARVNDMKDRIKELKHQIEVTTNEYNDHWNEAMDLQRLLRNYEGDLIRLQRIDDNNLESEGE